MGIYANEEWDDSHIGLLWSATQLFGRDLIFEASLESSVDLEK